VTFRGGARLDPSQVEDYRGRRLGGGGGVAIGGGGLGIVILALVIYFLGGGGGGSGNILGQLGGVSVGGPGDSPAVLSDCKTGADANARQDCRILAYVNSVQAYWAAEFRQAGNTYTPATTRFFTDTAATGCGQADAASGPFYCPNDKHVYIDLGFFNVLEQQFNVSIGSLAQGYVIAHEYGHHIQDLDGTLQRAGNDTGPQGGSVRTELQADCYAGVWLHHASDANGILNPPTDAEIQDALNAAATVGDDRIQKATAGRVSPETFTHGTSAQRTHWLQQGYRYGTPDSCDTFSGPI
jgi:uncharacterized protein